MGLVGSALSGNTAARGGGAFNGGTLTLAGTSLTANRADRGAGLFNERGTVTASGALFADNTAADNGGGFFNEFGTASFATTRFNGNAAHQGGGLYNAGRVALLDSAIFDNRADQGGGIFNGVAGFVVDNSPAHLFGSVTAANTTISGNRADEGGGLYNVGATDLADSVVADNSARRGGGIFNGGTYDISGYGSIVDSGSLRLSNTALTGNRADQGGGLFNDVGTASLTGVTISANSARDSGGGITNRSHVVASGGSLIGNSAVTGGGLYNEVGSARFTGGTIAGNTARKGAGYANFLGTVTLTSTAISDGITQLNTASALAPPHQFEPTASVPSVDDGEYRIDASGRLLRKSPGSPWAVLDVGVESFKIAPNGDVYWLTDHHELKRLQAGYSQTTVHVCVESFAMDADGTVYALDSLHNLTSFRSIDSYYVLPAIPEGAPHLAEDPPDEAFILRAAGIMPSMDLPQYIPPSPVYPFTRELGELPAPPPEALRRPVANGDLIDLDTWMVSWGFTLPVDVLANDTAANGVLDSSSLRITSGPAHGTATVQQVFSNYGYVITGSVDGDASIKLGVTGNGDYGFKGAHTETGNFTVYVRVGTSDLGDFDPAVYDFRRTGTLVPGQTEALTIAGQAPGTPFIAWVDHTIGSGAPDAIVGQMGSQIFYSPDPRFTGTDEIRYTVRDSRGKLSNEAAVRVHVGPGFAKDVQIVRERLIDRIDPPRVFPNVGLAQMHHSLWKATIYYRETMDGGERYYPYGALRIRQIVLDMSHLHLVAPGTAGAAATGSPTDAATSPPFAQAGEVTADASAFNRGVPPRGETNTKALITGPDGTVYRLGGGEDGFMYVGTDPSPGMLWRLSPGHRWEPVFSLYIDVWTGIVPQRTAPDGTVYQLTEDHELRRQSAKSGKWTVLDTGVGSFTMATDGTLYARNDRSELRRWLPGADTSSILDTGVQWFTMAHDGTIYEVNGRQELKRLEGRDQWAVIDSNVIAAYTGEVWGQLDGSLIYFKSDPVEVEKPYVWRPPYLVSSFAVGPDNTLFALDSEHRLRTLAPCALQWQTREVAVQSFAMAPDGTAYALSEAHELRRLAPRSGKTTTLLAGVASFAMTPEGTVYVLDDLGRLRRLESGDRWTTLDTGVQSIAMAADGALYELSGRGGLKRLVGRSGWTALDPDARSFSMAADGTVYDLDAGGRLKRLTARDHWTVLDTGVRSFVLAPSAFNNAYVLRDGGELRRLEAGHDWYTLRTDVVSITIDLYGVVQALDTSGRLWRIWSDFTAVVKPPILPNFPPPVAEDAPTDAEVLRVAGMTSGENVTIVRTLLVDEIDGPRDFAGIGPAQMHHCLWGFEVYSLDTGELLAAGTIDKDHLHAYVGPD